MTKRDGICMIQSRFCFIKVNESFMDSFILLFAHQLQEFLIQFMAVPVFVSNIFSF